MAAVRTPARTLGAVEALVRGAHGLQAAHQAPGDAVQVRRDARAIHAARALADQCVRMRCRREDATKEISMAKLFTGRMSRFVSDTCIQLHGGFGYMRESAAGRAYVDMRLISIGGGADEVMIQYLAKMLGF